MAPLTREEAGRRRIAAEQSGENAVWILRGDVADLFSLKWLIVILLAKLQRNWQKKKNVCCVLFYISGLLNQLASFL